MEEMHWDVNNCPLASKVYNFFSVYLNRCQFWTSTPSSVRRSRNTNRNQPSQTTTWSGRLGAVWPINSPV